MACNSLFFTQYHDSAARNTIWLTRFFYFLKLKRRTALPEIAFGWRIFFYFLKLKTTKAARNSIW